MYENHVKSFQKIYDSIARNYGEYTVFSDFVKICAISIYNSFAKNSQMEEEYLRTIKKYEKDEQQALSKMFAELVMMYKESKEVTDILGPFYEKEHLGNSHIGQFFTPSHISDLMSEMQIAEEETLRESIDENGFITMCEPSCGAGGMILSFAKALQKRNINYQSDLLVEATDISEVCAYMTYIQLALYGIPAVVYCGNALTLEIRFKMETPLFFLQYWKFRKFYRKDENKIERPKPKIIIDKPIENQNLYKEAIIKGNCQISLW